jgi:hypothetical protein
VAAALVHHPVYNREGEVVTTSVTSVDIHDIARACRTYGVEPYYMVTPIMAQREMVDRVAGHWSEGSGNKAGHPRGEAMNQVRTVPDLQSAISDFEKVVGARPLVVVTSANPMENGTTYAQLRTMIENADVPGLLILFGTGWGLAREVTASADIRLEPISGPTPYRHLSVRAAAAITLDRLMGVSIY